MMVRLYDTATRQVKNFRPGKGEVKLYTCGPTVYLDLQIGNWRTFIVYDLLVRTLKQAGYRPKHVLNITDVGHLVSDGDEGEDKLAKTARTQNKTAWEVAEKYIKSFKEGQRELNLSPPDVMPRATDHIEDQIKMIKRLETLGYTYVIGDGVYFDTSKFVDYGKLARLDLSGQQAGARVAINPEKKNARDFALWKFSPKDKQRDMEWDSPWGKGFPGWHIECSALALKYLGPTLDLHAGGIDLIPTHHTNEIAQSRSANQAPFAKHWLHVAFLTSQGKRLSKSAGNSYTLSQLKDKGFDPLAFRLFVLQAHYRSQSNFNWRALGAAQTRLNEIRAMSDLRFQLSEGPGHPAQGYWEQVEKLLPRALFDDLNSPLALKILGEFMQSIGDSPPSRSELARFEKALNLIDKLFGFNLLSSKDIPRNDKGLIARRENARKGGDFAAADSLRQQLKARGIGLRDTPQGAIWHRL